MWFDSLFWIAAKKDKKCNWERQVKNGEGLRTDRKKSNQKMMMLSIT